MLLSGSEHNRQGGQPVEMAGRRWRRMGTQGWRRLQFPSLLLTRSYWGLIHALNWWDIIDEHFFLGGALMFDDLERLQGQGVQAVVNLCAERPDNQHRLRAARMEYLWLPVLDAFPPTLEQIQQGVVWIEQQLHAGRPVYVHCAAGGMRVPQVLRFIKARRPQIALTRWQIRRLQEFEVFLRQRPTETEYPWRTSVSQWWANSN
jgi:atypical dual specificity phosphatase